MNIATTLIRKRDIISLHVTPTGKCALFFSLEAFLFVCLSLFSSDKSERFQKDTLQWAEHYVLQK